MTIPILDLLTLKYPNVPFGLLGMATCDNNNNIILWAVPGVAQPTSEQIETWQSDSATIQAYTFQQNKIINAPIYDQLEDLDRKTIRALREPDSAMITTLTTQAIALRAQLLPTS